MIDFPPTPGSYLLPSAFRAAMLAFSKHLAAETKHVEDTVTGVRVCLPEQLFPIRVVLPRNEAAGFPIIPPKNESTRDKMKRQKALKAQKASTYGQVKALSHLVPIVLAPSEHAHHGMLLIVRAASGGGKTWAAMQVSPP